MNKQEPSDIIEARKLLSMFEKVKEHSKRLRLFEDAIDILNQYDEEENDIEIAKLARNIRKTYTRKLLMELPSLNSLDIDDWFPYSVALLLKVKDDVEALCAENHSLKIGFDNFIKIWADVAIDIFSKHLKD